MPARRGLAFLGTPATEIQFRVPTERNMNLYGHSVSGLCHLC